MQIDPGATRTVVFAPAFLPRLYQNHEITAATAQVTITDPASNSSYETTVPVRLRSAEDMFWGNGFKYASFIASWVTPHDRNVESVLARAKAYTADHRLPGYETWKTAAQQEQETYREARAIFNALQRTGLSYVKSSATLGDHKGVSERVRMPRVSLAQSSANCIDAAVMYASLFENLGMDASIVIVPGHAYAGVRVAEGSSKFLLIDVALTGRSTFESCRGLGPKWHGQPCSFRGDAGDGGKSPFFRHLSHALVSNPVRGFHHPFPAIWQSRDAQKHLTSAQTGLKYPLFENRHRQKCALVRI